jgi:hypothetical protein
VRTLLGALMTEMKFRKVFSQFLDNYWGAYHEALEAQSVTPQRLAESLFRALHAEHLAFENIYVGSARRALDELGRLWQEVEHGRIEFLDAALTHAQIVKAQSLFKKVYRSLVHEGQQFGAARTDILKHALHGTPNGLLRADSAR